ncbi:MAG: hypothetical protein ABIK68_05880 [bacterium]
MITTQPRLIAPLLFLLTLLWLGCPAAHAVEITGTFREAGSQTNLTLNWSDESLSVTTERKPGELLFIFSQPIQLANTPAILEGSAQWIEDLVVSHTTIFIKLKEQVEYELGDTGSNGIQVRLKKTVAEVQPPDPGKTRLRTLKARLLFKQGKTDDALALINQLIDEQPDEISLLLIKADFIYELGRREEALDIVLLAEEKEPGNVGVRETKQRFQFSVRPFFVAEAAHKDTCYDLGERFYRIQFETRPLQRLAIGIKHSTYGIAYNRTGLVPPLIKENRQTEIYSTFERDSGSLIKLSLFIHVERDAGLALEHTWFDSDNTLTVGLDYQRPNWEYFVSQVETDHKHRLRLRYDKTINHRFSYMLFPALNQYVLWDLAPTPTSFSFQGAFIYNFHDSFVVNRWLGEHSYLTAEMDIDYEMPLSVDETDGITRSRFTKWVRSPRLNVGKQYRCWDFYGYMGYAFRVYNGSGRFWGGKILCEPRKDLDFYFKFDRYIDENSCMVTLLTLGMKWII